MDAFTAFIVCFVVTFALVQLLFYFANKRARKQEAQFTAELKRRQQAITDSLNAAAERMTSQRAEEESATMGIQTWLNELPRGARGPQGEKVDLPPAARGPQGLRGPRGHVPPRPIPAARAVDPSPSPLSTDWPTPLPASIHDYSPALAAPSYHGGGGSFDGGGASGDWGSSSSSSSGSSYSSSDSGSSSSDSSSSSSSGSD